MHKKTPPERGGLFTGFTAMKPDANNNGSKNPVRQARQITLLPCPYSKGEQDKDIPCLNLATNQDGVPLASP